MLKAKPSAAKGHVSRERARSPRPWVPASRSTRRASGPKPREVASTPLIRVAGKEAPVMLTRAQKEALVTDAQGERIETC